RIRSPKKHGVLLLEEGRTAQRPSRNDVREGRAGVRLRPLFTERTLEGSSGDRGDNTLGLRDDLARNLAQQGVEHFTEAIQVGSDPWQSKRVGGRQSGVALFLCVSVQQARGHAHTQSGGALAELHRRKYTHPEAVQEKVGQLRPR